MTTRQTQQVQQTQQTQPEVTKPAYQRAVEEFVEAEQKYKTQEEMLMSGSFLPEGRIRTDYLALIDSVKTLLEDRNAKLQTAAAAMRETVKIPETQWRGPEGKPDVQRYGPLEASSVTYRSIDAPTLFRLLAEREQRTGENLTARLLSVTAYDKQNRQYNIARQEWTLDYPAVKAWLLENNLADILTSSYDEKDGTPRVAGAKAIAFIGDKKE